MIDDIVRQVLNEARGRPGKDSVLKIYAVMQDIETRIIELISNIREEERRKEEDD